MMNFCFVNVSLMPSSLYFSLYPWVCKYGVFPVGHPEVLYGKDIPDQVQGFIKCKVLPPANLFHPVLPMRVNGKLLFPLCKTCAEGSLQRTCTHSDEERAFVGTWVSLELEKAVSMGYKVLERYSAWHFAETTQYNPETHDGGLWANYINLWLKEKQQADGYPAWCETDGDREKYVEDYYTHEGILLEPGKIKRNEGLRTLSKMMLNRYVR